MKIIMWADWLIDWLIVEYYQGSDKHTVQESGL